MRPRFLTRYQIMGRMHRGDLPVSCGGYSDAAVFNDGARASHNVMNHLIHDGFVDRPRGTCVMNPFTLRKGEGDNG